MEFQGLQNSLPVLIIVILFLLIFILSWYSYKKYDSISTAWKAFMSALRTISLCLLLILFMNPFFKKMEEINIKPKVAVLLDASESTSIIKGDYDGLTSYQSTLAQIRNVPKEVDLEFFSFGSSIQLQDPNNFSPTQPSTNLFNAIETVISSDEDYNSVVLISDGIITEGKNPVIEAENSPFPIHTVGIGDTSRVKDISIQNISTNATGFTNTSHVVDVDISQFGFGEQNIELNLSSGNTLIESTTITTSSDKEIESVDFEIELNSPGLKQYKIEVMPINGEWSSDNNSSSFSIEVLDSKKRILHIASSVHPDVKALRSILGKDQNIELSTYTYLSENSSIKDILPTDNYDLVIYHGDPAEKIITELNISNGETSSLFFLLADVINNTSNESFKIIANNARELFQVQLNNNVNQDHPIFEDLDIDLNSLPPIISTISGYNEYPDATILYNANFQNIVTNSPIVSVLEQGNIRKAHFNAFGWYKLYLSPNAAERDFVQQLVANLVDWTSSDPDNRLLKIKPTKNEFNSSETPVVNASLINENGEVETSGIIEITITGENYSSNSNMENLNNGNYRLQSPNLPNGEYSFTAVARKGNREIDTQKGEFLVSESNIELSKTIRNDDLLQNIAANSSGKFLDFSAANEFWNLPEISSSLVAKKEVQENYLFPVRSMYWFFLVLLLLGTEWILRKKFALP